MDTAAHATQLETRRVSTTLLLQTDPKVDGSKLTILLKPKMTEDGPSMGTASVQSLLFVNGQYRLSTGN